MINPTLKKILDICGIVALCVAAIAAAVFLQILFETYLGMAIDMLRKFFLAQNASEGVAITLSVLVVMAALIVLPFACYLIHKVNSAFTEKIESSYESFKNTNLSDNQNMFLEIYNDPTISLKDKILFCAIYAVYCIQRPFLYCASKVSLVNKWVLDAIFSGHGKGGNGIVVCAALTLLNAIILAPVALLELIKYPLIKLFSPLGLNVAQLSFLFNTSDVGSGSQSVHTPSFERDVIKCAKELKAQYGDESVISCKLDKEFEDYINDSKELTAWEKNLLKMHYFNFNTPNVNTSEDPDRYDWRKWKDPDTKLTLTQTANLVLITAREQGINMENFKGRLLLSLSEEFQCPSGMFNRIIYALSGVDPENKFTLVDKQVNDKIPEFTKQFLLGCSNQRIKFLKNNFGDFYFERDMNPKVKDDMSRLMEDATQYVFNELYVYCYDQYGKRVKEVGVVEVVEIVDGVEEVKKVEKVTEFEGVRRSIIKHKLQELLTDEAMKDAVDAMIDKVQTPPTYFERVKTFFCGAEHAIQPGC